MLRFLTSHRLRISTGLLALGLLCAGASRVYAAMSADEDCKPGAPCCYPGSPCCHHAK